MRRVPTQQPHSTPRHDVQRQIRLAAELAERRMDTVRGGAHSRWVG